MKAKIKATGKIVTITDNGEKFHPRYWDKSRGYYAEELEFLPEGTKTTTPPPAVSAFYKAWTAPRIDWPLLRRQKATLVKLAAQQDRSGMSKEAGHLNGIIALVDNLQDFAVDKGGLSEKKVFGRLK